MIYYGDYPISIHALLAESDAANFGRTICCIVFLSTLSLRRATDQFLCDGQALYHFYPRSPCGERPHIYTHHYPLQKHFYPRSPCGERLRHQHDERAVKLISIHALLAESDGEVVPVQLVLHIFLSTLSLRRATTHPC